MGAGLETEKIECQDHSKQVVWHVKYIYVNYEVRTNRTVLHLNILTQKIHTTFRGTS